MPGRRFRLLAWLAVAGLLQGCGGGSDPAPLPPPAADSRTYELGFTPWPYAASPDAVNFVYSEIAARGDFIAHHLDAGIPWQEALNGTPYPAAVEDEIRTRLDRTPAAMRSYLALSPLNGARDGLAGYWGDATNQPLPPPWDTRSLDDPAVITAYTNFAADLIRRFAPDYFNLGIEVSELALNDIAAFDGLVAFTAAVAGELRADFPDVRLMASVALKSPDSPAAATLRAALPDLLAHVDVVGISVYPFVFFDHENRGDPASLPTDWLSQVTALAGDKPVAIAETGWPAERLTIPAFGIDVASDVTRQNAYLGHLFAAAASLDAQFIVWFFLADYDSLWNDALQQDPVARIWRDTGLYDENLNPRPALDTWTTELERPLSRRN
jgi:hypothetical protein